MWTPRPRWCSVAVDSSSTTSAAVSKPVDVNAAVSHVERKLLFSPILPASMGRYDPRRVLSVGMDTRVRKWLPENAHVISVTNTPREGSIVVRLRVDAHRFPTHESLLDVVRRSVTARPAQTWFHLLLKMPPIDVYAVYGEPFLEDVRDGS